MGAILQGGVGDAGGGEADALLDHLDAGIALGNGDLLRTVAVAAEDGLAQQHLQAAAEAGGGGARSRGEFRMVSPKLPRRTDDKFLEVAVNGEAALLVSGDRDLLDLHPFRGIRVLTPAAYLAADAGPGG